MGYENSGRRPKPTALHILNGNPSRKKLNVNEVRPPAGEITKPAAGLSPGAGVVWDELAPICVAMGTLTPADVRPFAALCELQATFTAACAQKSDPNPAVQAYAVKTEKEYAPIIRPYYAMFGLEPVSRARISVPKNAGEPASKWAGALK